ncbi:MAG: InlB B-repeat-containing protein, partial [Paludibacteraceae bacterium]|nr:InlB B-repeat-containing protein [Paludibacteraceae bacterium]
MTEAALNDASICTVTGTKIYSWDGGVVLSNESIKIWESGAGGYNWDDKTLRIAVTGYPDSIYFSASHSGAATEPIWYLKESSDGVTSKTLEETTSGKDYAVKMSPTTKYIYIVYSGNLAGYIKNLRITPIYKLKVVSDGKILREEFVRAGTPITVDEQPTKDCHTFSGWDQTVPATMPAGDLTLNAQFDVIQYTSNFKVTNEELGVTEPDFSQEFDCGTDVSVKSPSQTGYEFDGWEPKLPTKADASMDGTTYTAKWIHNEYTLKLIFTEDSVIEKKLHYGDAINIETPLREGYTFREWNNEVPATMPTDNVILRAVWDVNQYTLTLKKGLDFIPQSETSELKYQAVISVEPLEHEGYTFLGWYPELPATMPATNFVTDAQWEVNQYRYVVYTSETDSVETLVNYGETLEPLAEQSKEGYTFKGWDIEQPSTMPANDLIIRAMWEINDYKLNFMVNDTLYESFSFTFGESVKVEVEDPEKVGYTFAGWDAEFPEIMPAEDLTYKAQWDVNHYRRVVYTSETDSTEIMIPFGTALPPLEAPSKVGYTFKGWDVEQPETMPAHDLVIRPIWQINQYTLTLMVDDTVYVGYTFDFGATVELTDYMDPEKEGHTFKGWLTKIVETMPAEDLIYEAQWEINQYRYVVYTWDNDSSEFYHNFATPLEPLQIPERVGYTFKGWDVEQPTTMPASDFIIRAVWEVNQYNICFKVDNDTLKTLTFEYGSQVDLSELKNPTKEGYTFTGWDSTLVEVMPAKDLSYNAVWQINSYRQVVYFSESDSSETTHIYRAELTPLENQFRVGYTFLGWDVEQPATMPAHDLVIRALWSANQYTMTFETDGEIIETFTFDFNAKVDLGDFSAPTKEGYTFAGWGGDVASVMPAENLHYVAQWNINTYNLILVIDSESQELHEYDYGKTIKREDIIEPVREGYTFLGWDNEIPTVMPAYDVILNAVWQVNVYDLNFVSDGKTYVKQRYAYGTNIDYESVSDPVRIGYTFKGWDNQRTNSVMPAKDLTLTALWEANRHSLIVIPDGENTSLNDTLYYNYGDPLAAIEEPTKEGHSFLGWSSVVPQTMPDESLVIKAMWSVNQYSLTTLVNCKPSVYTYTYGDDISIAAPEVEGYEFNGWSTEIPQTMPGNNLLVIADMRIQEFNFITQVGEQTDTVKYYYNDSIIVPEIPVKEGYTFEGWSSLIPETMPAQDLTIAPGWSVNSYKVVFVSDEDTLQMVSYKYGERINMPKSPAKTGYTFIEWYDNMGREIPTTMPAHDITLNADWKKNSYYFVTVADGDVFSMKYEYMDEIAMPEIPTRLGYDFVAWNKTVPSTMPAHNDTVVALWVVKSHNITWNVDEETTTITYNYGDPIRLMKDPQKVGYTFKGWDRYIPEVMPDENLVFNAVFEVNSYYFYVNVDGVSDSVLYEFGDTIQAITHPSKLGYTFAGWSEDIPSIMPADDVKVTALFDRDTFNLRIKSGEEVILYRYPYGAEIQTIVAPQIAGMSFDRWSGNFPKTMPAEDLLIEAYYKANQYQMVVVKGEQMDVLYYAYGDEIETPNAPTREGYTFTGWDVEYPTLMPDSNLVITAQWKVNQYDLIVIADDDTTTTTYNYNSLVEKPVSPSKLGYTFKGWNRDVPYTMPASDVRIVAEFVVDTFQLTTIVENTLTNVLYRYGDAITAPENPVREGYAFAGWNVEIPATMPAKDVVVEATWKVKQYDLTLIVDEDTTITSYDYNSLVEKPVTPSKEGYLFKGWSEDVPYMMPAENVSIAAEFVVDTFMLTFIVENVKSEVRYCYGELVNVLETPAREGYTFAGWSVEIPATMPAENLVAEAQWKVNQYDLILVVDGDSTTTSYDFGELVEEPTAP